MASVTFPTNVGGDGSTVSDDANTTTGLADGGHRPRFVPAHGQVVGIATNLINSATSAATSAALAINAPGTQATSASSLTIGAGSQSLTLAQTGKSFVLGQWVVIADASAPADDWMAGAITAFNSGTGAMTVSVVAYAGAGTATSWTVTPSSPIVTYVPVQYGPLI